MIYKNTRSWIDIIGVRIVQIMLIILILVMMFMGFAVGAAGIEVLGVFLILIPMMFFPLLYVFQRSIHHRYIRKVEVKEKEVTLFYKSKTIRIPFRNIYHYEITRENGVSCPIYSTKMGFIAHPGGKRGVFNAGFLDEKIKYAMVKKMKKYSEMFDPEKHITYKNRLYKSKVGFWRLYLDFYVWFFIPVALIFLVIIRASDDLVFPILLIILFITFFSKYFLLRKFYFNLIPRKVLVFNDRIIFDTKWKREVLLFKYVTGIGSQNSSVIIDYLKDGKERKFKFHQLDDKLKNNIIREIGEKI